WCRLQQGCGCNRRKMDSGVTAIAEEGSSGLEQEMAIVMFSLLLAAIKIVGNERLLQAAM
ncbi:hypothetical protein BHM03_00062990, partial [Ensete ventricosum]